MDINKIAQTAYYKQAGKGKVKESANDFAERFLGSLNSKMKNSDSGVLDKRERVALQSKGISEKEYLYGVSSRVAVSSTRVAVSEAVTECEVRGISYRQSDHVKLCIEKGYVYKAQVDKEKEAVYVEEKDENGLVKGYEVDPNKISEDTEDELEEFSLAAWRKALSNYINYAHERIKNGPEKFQIGASEFSIKEWDKLIEKIDKDIEAVKEEQKERLEKEAASELAEKLSEKQDDGQ